MILRVPTHTAVALMGWPGPAMAKRYQHLIDVIRRDVASQLQLDYECRDGRGGSILSGNGDLTLQLAARFQRKAEILRQIVPRARQPELAGGTLGDAGMWASSPQTTQTGSARSRMGPTCDCL